MSERARPPSREPFALALLLALACGALALLGDWRARLGAFQACWLAAFAIYGVVVARRSRWRGFPRAGLFVWLVALVLRLLVVPVTPTLSDDVWRYRWDGRVGVAGIDPWRHAPADTALAFLRDTEVHPRINHPDLRTIYPPVAELGFALVAGVDPSARGWKMWVLAHDLLLCALLIAWCVRRGGSAWDAAIYAWNPLAIVEYAGSGHHDPTGIVWLVLALMLAEGTSPRAGASALAGIAAAGVKLVAIPVLAFLARAWTRAARLLALVMGAGLLAVFLARATGPASGLVAFTERWRHDDALFGWLDFAFGARGARIAVAVALLAVVVTALRERLGNVPATQLFLRAGVLLGPVVHPWYLGWLLALEPLRPSAPWLLLSCTIVLGYGAFAPPAEGGAYHPNVTWRAVQYGLPALLALGLAWSHDAKRRSGSVRKSARPGEARDER